MSLEEDFVEACKSGNMMLVVLAVNQQVDLNYRDGWALRSAIMNNQPRVWKYLLAQKNLDVNAANDSGMSPLHIACGFNIFEAVSDLLKHPDIMVNKRSTQIGNTPVMVAAKHGKKEAFEDIIRDNRVDLDMVDFNNRALDKVVGLATDSITEDDRDAIITGLEKERSVRKELKTLLEGQGTLGFQTQDKMVCISGIVRTKQCRQSTVRLSEPVLFKAPCTKKMSKIVGEKLKKSEPNVTEVPFKLTTLEPLVRDGPLIKHKSEPIKKKKVSSKAKSPKPRSLVDEGYFSDTRRPSSCDSICT